MPNFEAYYIVKWLHLICLALGGGSAMIILILVGFEDGQEELKGMTSILWKRIAAWAFRLAVLLGIVLVAMQIRAGGHPFQARYLHVKLLLVVFLLMFSELSGRSLAKAKRGAAMLAILLFLLTTFVSVNSGAFGNLKHRPGNPGTFAGAAEQGAQ